MRCPNCGHTTSTGLGLLTQPGVVLPGQQGGGSNDLGQAITFTVQNVGLLMTLVTFFRGLFAAFKAPKVG